MSVKKQTKMSAKRQIKTKIISKNYSNIRKITW